MTDQKLETINSILIVGATGKLGEKATRAILQKKRFQIYLFTREASVSDASKSKIFDELKNLGAKIILGNLFEVDNIKKILMETKVDIIISFLRGLENIVQGQLNLIQAAKEVGTVKHFIPSEFNIDIQKYEENYKEYYKPELQEFVSKNFVLEALKKSGINYTIIHTGVWLEYLISPYYGLDFKNCKAVIPGDGNSKFTSIHSDDIANLIAEILLHLKPINQQICLIGDTFTLNEVVDTFENLSGKKVERQYEPLEKIKKRLESAHGLAELVLFVTILAITTPAYALNYDTIKTDYSYYKPKTLQNYVKSLLQK